jgi:anaphase-promoting complex subunit 2
MEESTLSLVSNLEILDTLSADSVQEIVGSYGSFCSATLSLLHGGDASDLFSHVQILCKHGLLSLVRDFFLKSLEVSYINASLTERFKHLQFNVFFFFMTGSFREKPSVKILAAF